MSIEEKWQEVDQIRRSYQLIAAVLLKKEGGEVLLSSEDLKATYFDRDKIIESKYPDGSIKLRLIKRCSKCNGWGAIKCPECDGSGYYKEE